MILGCVLFKRVYHEEGLECMSMIPCHPRSSRMVKLYEALDLQWKMSGAMSVPTDWDGTRTPWRLGYGPFWWWSSEELPGAVQYCSANCSFIAKPKHSIHKYTGFATSINNLEDCISAMPPAGIVRVFNSFLTMDIYWIVKRTLQNGTGNPMQKSAAAVEISYTSRLNLWMHQAGTNTCNHTSKYETSISLQRHSISLHRKANVLRTHSEQSTCTKLPCLRTPQPSLKKPY